MLAYALDKGEKLLCFDKAATLHTVLIKIPATNPFQYTYKDFHPRVALRSKSQTLLLVRNSPIQFLIRPFALLIRGAFRCQKRCLRSKARRCCWCATRLCSSRLTILGRTDRRGSLLPSRLWAGLTAHVHGPIMNRVAKHGLLLRRPQVSGSPVRAWWSGSQTRPARSAPCWPTARCGSSWHVLSRPFEGTKGFPLLKLHHPCSSMHSMCAYHPACVVTPTPSLLVSISMSADRIMSWVCSCARTFCTWRASSRRVAPAPRCASAATRSWP